MSQKSTFWRVCNDAGVCHCDWRYSIYDCAEEKLAIPVYIALAIVSGICVIVFIGILYHRIKHKKQKVFQMRKGFPRPKPVESMLMMGLIFSILQTIRSIIMLTDIIPNTIFRAFIYEFALQFGYYCFACYLFGIAYAISESSRVMYNSWVRSQTVVDVLFLCSVFCPFFTTTSCAVAAGYHASLGENEMAARLTKIQYYAWGFFCGSVALVLLFAGLRLMRILDRYIALQEDLRVDTLKVRTGALKVKMIVVSGTLCMGTFALLLASYGGLRSIIMKDTTFNIAVAIIWLFAGPLAAFFIIVAILINPGFAAQFGSVSFGSDEENNNNSRKLTSLELDLSKGSKNSRASQFIIASSASSPTDNEARFTFQDAKPLPLESINSIIYDNSRRPSAKIEEERCTINANIERVREAPHFYK